MRPLGWKETAELIGLFAILVSLVVVAMQLQQQEELLQLELQNNLLSNSVAVNEKIIDNPDLWVRGNSGEELSAAESAAYESLLINVNDSFYHTYNIFNEVAPEMANGSVAAFAGFLARNPGAHRVWIDRERQLYADRAALDVEAEGPIALNWMEMIESRVAVIKSNPPSKAP